MTVYTGVLRAAGLAKEDTPGTLKSPPSTFIRLIPPDSMHPSIAVLESAGIATIPDLVYKAVQGAGTLNGMKVKMEMEPEQGLGEHLMSLFGTDTVSTIDTTAGQHIFTRAAVGVPPQYSWWKDAGASLYPQFVGCLVNKLDISSKSKEFAYIDAEWVGMSYDGTGSSHSPTYSALVPQTFTNLVLSIGGSQVLNYDDVKITFDNMVKAEHVLNGSIWPGIIYSEGLKVNIEASMYLQNSTEWSNFLNGTTTSFAATWTSLDTISGSSPTAKYSLAISIPTIRYKSAPLDIQKGIIKVKFDAVGVYTVGSTKTASATLVNSKTSAY